MCKETVIQLVTRTDRLNHIGDRIRDSRNSVTWLTAIGLLVFLFVGWRIVSRSLGGGNAPEVINYHYMLLDGWSVAFVGLMLALWWFRPKPSLAASIVLVAIAAYGAISLAIVLAPSLFPDNGYWGDQKFRIAMIQHFMTHGTLTDYYYRDLPIFYPPTYYYILALIGKLTGQPAYKMAQVGLSFLFIVTPVVLYWLWRKLLSQTAALVVTASVMLMDIGGSFMLVAAPHAFLANSLFVPWCLFYVFGSGQRGPLSWEQWLAGSMLGAVILTTYFYPFILLGFVILICGIASVLRCKWTRQLVFSWKETLGVISGVGLLSAWYWLPNVLAVAKFGMDRSRGDWYHAGSDGLGFPFLEWNWLGIIGLLSIVYLFRRRIGIVKQLLVLLACAIAFFGVGSFLGAMDISFNLTKDREFVWALMTPVIGLALFTLTGKFERHRSGRIGGVVIVAMLLLFCTRGMTRLAHDSYFEKARATTVPDFGLTKPEVSEMADKVLLASNEECFAFLPAKAFININEHYAHPASQFALRYDFLTHLCKIGDRRLFHYALSHNRFDAIDYILPEKRGDSIWLYVALSAYPDGLVLKQLAFPAAFLEDTSLYHRVGKSSLYRVLNLKDDQLVRDTSSDGPSNAKAIAHSQATLSRLQQSTSRTPENFIIPHVNSLVDPANPVWLDKSLLLTDCVVVGASDSMTIVATLRKNRPVHLPARLYLHVYAPPNNDTLQNYDFPPFINIAEWPVGDVITVERRLPRADSNFSFVLGIFGESGPWGRPFVGHVPVDSLNGYRVPPRDQELISIASPSRR